MRDPAIAGDDGGVSGFFRPRRMMGVASQLIAGL